MIYFDFSKAFDSVPRGRLLTKLKSYGIQDSVSVWIQDFLTDRLQRVILENSESAWIPVTCGVPHCSVLGPVLFLLYVKDLSEMVQSVVKLFADDTKLYHISGSQKERGILQKDINSLCNWSATWKLPFNIGKCRVCTWDLTTLRLSTFCRAAVVTVHLFSRVCRKKTREY